MQWWLLRAKSESEAEYNTLVEGLSKQLEEGKKAIWEAHEQVSEIATNSENEKPKVNVKVVNKPVAVAVKAETKPVPMVIEKQPKPVVAVAVPAASTRPTRGKKATVKKEEAATKAAPPKPKNDGKPDTIHIDVVGGPYDGKFYDLQPKSRSHAWVGRSSSNKFKKSGISLPLDLEVSTTHGRFEYKQGKFYYQDTGSTNGTLINGEFCEPGQQYELKPKGMVITTGQTVMKVTLLRLE